MDGLSTVCIGMATTPAMRARRRVRLPAALLTAVFAAFVAVLAAGPAVAETGLPVPRFVSLRANEINVRTGPGRRYPILWVFQRRSLPVEIIAEYDTWRRIRDREGAVGWVHQSTLSGRRSVIVAARTRTLRRKPTAQAPPVALAEAGVIAGLLECADEWCRIDAQGYRGWLKRDEVWGVYAGEKLD